MTQQECSNNKYYTSIYIYIYIYIEREREREREREIFTISLSEYIPNNFLWAWQKLNWFKGSNLNAPMLKNIVKIKFSIKERGETLETQQN